VKTATFRFYAELHDFLPPEGRTPAIEHHFVVSGSVKDMIEALGVPHTEVDLVLANGASVGFDYQVQDGDRIAVYPLFRSLDIGQLPGVRPAPPPSARFVLDTHLGRLAAYLRLLGFDTLYRNDYRDGELARISAEEARILLTMDRGLLKRGMVRHGYFIRDSEPRQQLLDVLRRFNLLDRTEPFTRCLRCNALLEEMDRQQAADRVPPGTLQHYHEFRTCPQCRRVYWKGSHYRRMARLVESIAPRPGCGKGTPMDAEAETPDYIARHSRNQKD
jgi:hypothetical protein